MSDFTAQRSDIRRAFEAARIFAVSKRIALSAGGGLDGIIGKLASAGVRTVFFDGTEEFEPDGAVVLAFCKEDAGAAGKAAFFTASASACLEVKMLSSYVSSFDGEEAALEIGDLIIAAKKS